MCSLIMADVTLRWCFLVAMLVFLVESTYAYPSHKYEGDQCTSVSGQPGVCKLLSDCPRVLESIQSRSKTAHARCGFQGFQEVVCCCDSDEPTPQRLQARKSAKACEQFRRDEKSLVGFFILGGTETREGEFPHMAALGFTPRGQDKLSWLCGGSLISDQYLLTAAHCVTDWQAGQLKVVRLGELELSPDPKPDVDYAIEKVVLHPRYKKKFNYDDLALVKLSSRVKFTSNVMPACLSSTSVPEGVVLTATGWGAIDAGGIMASKRLLKTNVTSLSLSTCKDALKPFGKLPDGVRDDMLCARDPSGRADTCLGDSGGPLQLQESRSSSMLTVAGVTSFGSSPCGGRKPSVYARVSSYLDWIEGEVWP